MNTTLKTELLTHVISTIKECNLESFEELHQEAFNNDYYIVGYYQAEQWLKEHDISAFEAIETVQDYEVEMFGEVSTKINSESIVNMYTYIKGEELLSDFDLEQTQTELLADLEGEL